MTRRRAAGSLSLAIGVLAVVVGITAAPASANSQPPDETAWWFELQTKTLPAPLPNPPVVPDGGLYVQQGVNGAVAYSAVRARIPDVQTATLLLTAASGSSTTTLPAALQACVAQGWTAPTSEPGAWEDRATFGTQCAPGIVSSDGSAVAFFFDAGFFAGDELDVAIVPTAAATPFAIAFDKPDAQSLQTVIAASAPTTTTTFPSAVPASGGGNINRVATPTVPVAAPTPPAAPAPAAELPVAKSVLNIAGLGDPDRGARALALGGASLIVVGWWLMSTRALPMPRLLGSLAGASVARDEERPEAHVAGVGRFARRRDRPARSLR